MSDEPRYSLAGGSLISSRHRSIKDIRPLGENELTQLDIASRRIGDFETQYSLYEICQSNYHELIAHYEKVCNEYKATHNMEDPIGRIILTELNRLLMNYLSSFRTMIDHYETRYTRPEHQGTHWLKSFKCYTTTIYDSSFAYRFFYRLRNYVQHCALPLGGINAEVHKDKQGEVVAALSVFFNRDDLLITFDGWGKVRIDLQSQPLEMEISHYLTQFHQAVATLFSDCNEIELELVSEAHSFLSALIKEVETQMPGATPLIVDFTGLSKSGGKLTARLLPLHGLELIQRLAEKRLQPYQA